MRWIFFLFLWGLGGGLRGLETARAETTLEKTLIQSNINMSKGIDSIAESLDLFLAGGKVTNKANPTSVVISNATYKAEGSAIKNETHLDVNLRMPNLEESWQLRFTSYDENEEDRGVNRTYFRRNRKDENYGASLGLFRRFGNVRTTFRPRLELKDPLHVSYILRFESTADFTSQKLKPKLEFFADPEKGTGIYGAVNWDFLLSGKSTLTLINEGEYQDFENRFSVTNGVAYGQVISRKAALVHALTFSSVNQPSYNLDQYVFSSSLGLVVYRRILEMQISPYLSFPRHNDFKGISGITLNLDLIF